MARAKLKAKVYMNIGNEKVLCFERDGDGNVTWHLPEETIREYEQLMLKNISKSVSEYVRNNPDCGILHC